MSIHVRVAPKTTVSRGEAIHRDGPLAVIGRPLNPNVIVVRALATFVARVEYAARLN